MLSFETLGKIDDMLSQLDAIIDNIMYKHYSPEGLKKELDSIEALRNEIQETMAEMNQ